MVKKLVLILAILILLLAWLAFGSGPAAEQGGTKQFARYPEMRRYLGELYAEKKYQEAAALIEAHLDKFPENLSANIYNLALMHLKLGEKEKAVGRLAYALDRGVWFGKYAFYDADWAPLKDLPSGIQFLVVSGDAAGRTLRFNRLGGFCNPAGTSCGTPVSDVCTTAESSRCGNGADASYVLPEANGTLVMVLVEQTTQLRRADRVMPGGRVMASEGWEG